jgi:glycosyltransferase involved in cell wall biosynthesis
MRRRIELDPGQNDVRLMAPDGTSGSHGQAEAGKPSASPDLAASPSAHFPAFAGLNDAARKLASHDARRSYQMWMALRRAGEKLKLGRRGRAAEDLPSEPRQAPAATPGVMNWADAMEAARALRLVDPRLACDTAARGLDPAALKRRHRIELAEMRFDAGDIAGAAELLTDVPSSGLKALFVPKTVRQIRSWRRLRQNGVAVPPRATPTAPGEPGRVLYVCARSLADTINGYAVRTRELVRGLGEAGWQVNVAVTNPKANGNGGRADEYVITMPPEGRADILLWIDTAAAALERLILRTRPAIVHATSNYANALPALVAARRTGRPFVYELRGAWHETHGTLMPAWRGSEHWSAEECLERQIIAEADHVFALNSALARWAGAEGRVSLLTNAAAPAPAVPTSRAGEIRARLGLEGEVVVGYVGSLMAYEGLDDLILGVARLRAGGRRVKLLLVGNGPVLAGLIELAHRAGAGDAVVVTGRVKHEKVSDYYSAIDIAAVPRKSMTVTELVMPLKPFEAMAAGKPILASDVEPMREFLTDGREALLFRKGSLDDLTHVLTRLVDNPALRQKLGFAGRQSLQDRWTWAKVAGDASEVYRRLIVGTPA